MRRTRLKVDSRKTGVKDREVLPLKIEEVEKRISDRRFNRAFESKKEFLIFLKEVIDLINSKDEI